MPSRTLGQIAQAISRHTRGEIPYGEILQAIADANVEVNSKYDWPWTRKDANIQIHPSYSDGTIDVADGLRDLRVPKLSVQPLVENSLRHGIDVPPPWRIAIAASREDARWRVTVRDHGGGFPEEVLASIRSRMAAFDESGAMPSVHVQGMGILSIFLRLRLLYGDGASFEVGNAPDGGALVAFGAPG